MHTLNEAGEAVIKVLKLSPLLRPHCFELRAQLSGLAQVQIWRCSRKLQTCWGGQNRGTGRGWIGRIDGARATASSAEGCPAAYHHPPPLHRRQIGVVTQGAHVCWREKRAETVSAVLLLWREVCEDAVALAGLFIVGGETLTQSFLLTAWIDYLPVQAGMGSWGVEGEITEMDWQCNARTNERVSTAKRAMRTKISRACGWKTQVIMCGFPVQR